MATPRAAIATTILLALLAGCTVGPDYVRPEIETPDEWNQELAEGLEPGDANHRAWWTSFDDPVLDGLIDRAREGNLNLKVAVSRVREARALRKFQAAGWAPKVNALGEMSYGRTSESVQPVLPAGVHRTDTSFSAGFDASWELDVWGRVSRAVESADAAIEAS
ncbi:MAG: TolC family protein, partial [Planctomycetota bacterium]